MVTSPPYWGLRDYGTGNDQIGLEETPEEFVEAMVDVFREVKRVLRDDGTLWLNLGDSYAGAGPSGASYQSETTKRRAGQKQDGNFSISKSLGARGLTYKDKRPVPPPGMKSKDLVGIPWLVAFALRKDGWYLRSDIIWAKGSCMPESVKDRPTRSHEYLFLLAKSPKYYYDHEAIKELSVTADPRSPHGRGQESVGGRAARGAREGGTKQSDAAKRNKRSVWKVNPVPYAGAHFAVFPPNLVAPCILAGTSEKGCCPVCGTPWDRTPEGWEAACGCPPHEPVPCKVLDPFSGSGTTGAVALDYGRDYVGLDLSEDYLELAQTRLLGEPPVKPSDDEGDGGILDLLGVQGE